MSTTNPLKQVLDQLIANAKPSADDIKSVQAQLEFTGGRAIAGGIVKHTDEVYKIVTVGQQPTDEVDPLTRKPKTVPIAVEMYFTGEGLFSITQAIEAPSIVRPPSITPIR